MIGRVSDSSGAVIPGVWVKVSSVNLPGGDVVREAVTNASGQFDAPNLPIGSYEVIGNLQGFKSSMVKLQVRANEDSKVEIKLELGQVAEVVVIKGTPGISPINTEPMPDSPYPSTADEAYKAAKLLYERGRLPEAELMTNRAIDLLPSPDPPLHASVRTSVDPNSPVKPIRVGGGIREPKKTNHVVPIFPPDALAAEIQDSVTIEAIISTNGSVKNARVVKGNSQLNAAALGAVRQWRYSPAGLNGTLVEVAMTVTVNFVTVR